MKSNEATLLERRRRIREQPQARPDPSGQRQGARMGNGAPPRHLLAVEALEIDGRSPAGRNLLDLTVMNLQPAYPAPLAAGHDLHLLPLAHPF